MSRIISGPRRARELLEFFYVQRTGALTPPGQPELDQSTVARLRRELAGARTYLEYGSGGSTLLAAAAGVPTVSVESDRFFAAKVKQALPRGARVDVLVPPMGLTRQWGHPVFGAHRKGARYVTAPFAGGRMDMADLVLIDGRYRAACALEVARRARNLRRSVRIIFDDYRRRPIYHGIEQWLGAPELCGRAAVFAVGEQEIPASALDRCLADAR